MTTKGDHEVTFKLGRPQPSFLSMLAARLFAGLHPATSRVATCAPNRSAPGRSRSPSSSATRAIKLVRNPDYWKKGRPYLDVIDWKIVPNRSTRMLGFTAGEFDMTFDSDVTFPLLKGRQGAEARRGVRGAADQCQLNILINRDKPPFDNPQIRRAMVLAIDIKSFHDILSQGMTSTAPPCTLPPPAGYWACRKRCCPACSAIRPTSRRAAPRRARSWKAWATAPTKPLKIKVATRNIAIYRDPAVILIDQLKKIHIDGELDPIDTTVWYNKVQRKDYQVGMNLTGAGVDDPDVQFLRELLLDVRPQLHGLQEPRDRQADRSAVGRSRSPSEAQELVWEIEAKLANDVARPIIGWQRRQHLLDAAAQGRPAADQQHLQRLAFRRRPGWTGRVPDAPFHPSSRPPRHRGGSRLTGRRDRTPRRKPGARFREFRRRDQMDLDRCLPLRPFGPPPRMTGGK